MIIRIEEIKCKQRSPEYNISENKFSKLETNMGMLHFQSHTPKNHITNLETNTPLYANICIYILVKKYG